MSDYCQEFKKLITDLNAKILALDVTKANNDPVDLIMQSIKNIKQIMSEIQEIDKNTIRDWGINHLGIEESEIDEWIKRNKFNFSNPLNVEVNRRNFSLDLLNGTIDLPYIVKINGSFHTNQATIIHADYLQYINGGLFANKAKVLRMNKLQKIDGGIQARNAKTVLLNSITEINGKLFLSSVHRFQADELSKVKGFISIDKAVSVKVNNLRTVGSLFSIASATSLQAEHLEVIKGDFRITKLDKINLPSLCKIQGKLYVKAGVKLPPNVEKAAIGGIEYVK